MQLDPKYMAGLFDGEGTVLYKKYKTKKKKKYYYCWFIEAAIEMTHQDVLELLNQALPYGSLWKRKTMKPGRKQTWRWKCKHKNAYKFAKLLLPYSHVKREALQQIIDHYDKLPVRHTNDRDVHFHHVVSRHGHYFLNEAK